MRLTIGLFVLLLGLSFCSDTAAQADPSVVGRWSLVPDLPFFPVHVHVLPTGKVMIWPGDDLAGPGGGSGNDVRLWDPVTATTSFLTPPGYDVFCSGHSFLADGRLFVAGGHIQNGVGMANASTYDPFTDLWTRVPDMNAGRWYPTATTLANGDVLVVAGDIDNAVGENRLPQVFQVQSDTWRNLTNAQINLDLYPRMHLAPNGRVFNSAPSMTTRYLDTSGTGEWTVVANRSVNVYRDYGSSVMYEAGRVLLMGGGDPPTNTAEVIDLNAPTPAWRAVASMAFARRQLNATILPDGKVLVTGGTSGPGFNNINTAVFAAEIWDPATENWTTMASAQIPRLYHSAVVLLPDGRLLSTGGNGFTQTEIYEPPYLFKGARPTIISAPTTVSYEQTFFVETPDATNITQVTWIALSSTTHAFNMNQRINRLNFSQVAGGLSVSAPSSGNLAPAGYYMLFILNSSGVPSVAKIMQLTSSSNVGPTLSSLSPNSASAGGPAFTLTVNGSNFVSGSVVRWNGAARSTTFVSATQLTAAIPVSDIVTAGSAQVTVINPAGGGTSNALTFTINALSVSPTTIPAGGTITATWSGLATPTARDWIGLYVPGAANTAYIDWIYVSCSKTAGSARAFGSCPFIVPSTVVLGGYELRLFANDGSTLLATSNVFTVMTGSVLSVSPTTIPAGGTITATWSGLATPTATDWIGLYAAAAEDYIDWIYVSCSKTTGSARAFGSCPLTMPSTLAPGNYQLRLYANNSSTLLAGSNSFTIGAPSGTLQFSVATYSVAENGGNATITITRTGGSAGVVGVMFATSNGTATAPSDYTAVTQTISFANGDTANKTVSIPIIDDTLVEGNETVNLALSNPTGGATLGSPSTAVLTIIDNDVAPAGILQFSAATYSVAENGGNATITITRTGGSTGVVGVRFATSNGTATAASDYTAVTQTVSFANGDTANKTVSIPIIDDTLVEGNETVNLTLTNPTGGATLGSPSTAVLTIIDNDVAPAGTLQFSAATYSVAENGGNATITITRTGGSAGVVGVTFATSNSTATAPSDYTAVTQTVSFANGDTANKTVSIPIIDDTLVEGNETVNLTLTNPTGGATLGSPSTAVLTIIDNDVAPAGTLQFSAATYSVAENGGNATITITRTGGSAGVVGVTFATSNGTATAPSDYTAVTQTVSFANGDTANKTVSIPIIDDTLVEGNETVNLTLSNPTGGATLGSPSTAALTIIDNDTAGVTLSESPTTVATGGTITATWSGIATPTARDWIGLYTPSAGNTSYIDWIYVSCSKTPGSARASGSCSFVVPTTVAPGTYQLRLFANDGFTHLATSNSFTVAVPGGVTLSESPTTIARGGTITAIWNNIANPTPTDWIGLYIPSAGNTSFIDWIYVSCSKTPGSARASGSCSFVVPTTVAPGTYQLRLLASDGFTLLTTSNAFTVQ